ncbi:ETC complex I subunit conserved region-domain-containing protein [Radiomyces spectabilis]|uniref:ETC complex I subunit conserved region-domain-containing protein n=1 Tax=Radiomyces spectabilis TaxID=64574 RepID=UPI00221E68CF|nr:ETC complex I subunit conserved region-domain-containing protein [Radiomyces spectabilis]KAI8381472.1 ETC complex I subunit conserved region-domain-containing protein [Radiomyces spectabilis]
MSSPLIVKAGAAAARSFIRPAVALRYASSQSKAVTHADNQPVVSVDAVSGAPEELLERSVRIFSPSKTATQSGKNGTRHWRIDFDILEEGNRWENPLIGWASSADYQQALAIKFTSKESAIRFAEKQGWNYYVQEPKAVKWVKKAYADNYKYSPGPLRMIKTK